MMPPILGKAPHSIIIRASHRGARINPNGTVWKVGERYVRAVDRLQAIAIYHQAFNAADPIADDVTCLGLATPEINAGEEYDRVVQTPSEQLQSIRIKSRRTKTKNERVRRQRNAVERLRQAIDKLFGTKL